jgi:hypothetical protein
MRKYVFFSLFLLIIINEFKMQVCPRSSSRKQSENGKYTKFY